MEVFKVWIVECLNIFELSILRDWDVDRWFYLKGIEFLEIDIKEVWVFIGCNVFEVFWVFEEKCGSKGELVGICLLLGWMIIGLIEKIG